ncbi:hypothetical protein [Paenibacillus cucumis (ex Kampfer et al. 2016)]|uniref:Uncharacterized protein n=1 Tax=Paenibacillus cucumis (ex Kampfer et al. 2016) TaxID=1776858 RepID=A0ABS7KDE8_9BACL|nr:hypothetical protein [Paenibacillus cucumis (ex Kampfer et al. 2016)]MBY0202001.1 hypothetical protein [Paenibacillus cucumis (ex Kampfer et al. 2016)]
MGAKTIPSHSSPLKRYISGSGEPVICQAEWQEEGREQLTLSEMSRIWFRNPLQHNILVRNIKRVTREQGRH